jgi:transcriptional regulator with XRE-family HTH domain
MTLGEKLRGLRRIEGQLRGLERDMTQGEVVRAIRKELGPGLSQPYLSQIENGLRTHLSAKSRALLARFFKVHPGYLVDDPQGYRIELVSSLRTSETGLDEWLREGASRFEDDAPLSRALRAIEAEPDSREALLLLESILRTPKLPQKLGAILRPGAKKRGKAT